MKLLFCTHGNRTKIFPCINDSLPRFESLNDDLQVQIFLDYPLNTPWLFYLIRVHTIRETL